MTNAPTRSIRGWAQGVASSYAHGQDRPLAGYVATLSVYGGLVAGLAATGKVTGRRIPRLETRDLLMACLATHKLSRTIAKDPIVSPLRAPFAIYKEASGEAELTEEVRGGSGAVHAIGELVTCPFCLAQWVGTAFVAGLVIAPRWTRLVISVMSVKAAADFLQFGYDAVQKTTTER